MAQLYKIVHIPSQMEYYGSAWGKKSTYLTRFDIHMAGNGALYIKRLLDGDAIPSDFSCTLLLIGSPKYVCDIEMQLARNNLYPMGLNGNAGRNIIRTPEGQKRVSDAVSAGKIGKTKINHDGVATQARKLAAQTGSNRTKLQKLWDNKKPDKIKQQIMDGERSTPIDVTGMKFIHDPATKKRKLIQPHEIYQYTQQGWELGQGPGKKYIRHNVLIIEAPDGTIYNGCMEAERNTGIAHHVIRRMVKKNKNGWRMKDG